MSRKKNHRKRQSGLLIKVVSVVCLILLIVSSFWYFTLKAPELPYPPVKDLAAAHHVALGIHIDPKRLDSRVYPDIAISQFNLIIIDGGGSHFAEVHPKQNTYDFSQTDKLVNFAAQHNMPVQFHHLVWGDDYVMPKWLVNGKFSQQELLDILHDHVTTIVKRYKGRIAEYSAVNEAITENKHLYGLQNWWAEHLGGTDYMDKVFVWARQADPSAKLILNDFNNEVANEYSDAQYHYIKSAKARGIPIDAIGMQMHVDAANRHDRKAMAQNMRRFVEIGVPVYITEFDINTNRVVGSNDQKQKLESDIASDVVGACIDSKSCQSFTVFGISSMNSKLKKITSANARAYMFDSRYRPRQQYYSFRTAWK